MIWLFFLTISLSVVCVSISYWTRFLDWCAPSPFTESPEYTVLYDSRPQLPAFRAAVGYDAILRSVCYVSTELQIKEIENFDIKFLNNWMRYYLKVTFENTAAWVWLHVLFLFSKKAFFSLMVLIKSIILTSRMHLECNSGPPLLRCFWFLTECYIPMFSHA